MPPRKKRRQPSQKAQLLFHHQPLEGPKHSCASTQLPITHTRQVSPDFATTAGSLFPAYRKHHHQNRARHSSRKSTTSKFPHLTFESPQSSSSETLGIPFIRECPSASAKDVSRRPLVPVLSPQSCGDMSAQALQGLPYVFIPPDIQTPESSSVKEELVPRDQKENSLPSCSLHAGTPSSPEPGPVLVEDTPEDKYGIKVTWRRRQHLLAYLRERGKLSRSQFLVKS
ncbi:RAD9, HUS1, RAD1-interacting nuclear orphan protein 1 isoform X2 [Trachypithecus francoisi]|uniref:RAD9, HUS1, RAD1-interacting nuclear orphan protein 1 isoform X2 n=1 Tax=Trachypithecus francoisi TaxID=54180 RepID=UPI00141B3C5E|nr:RAD9, HUS1, RAD1-interacting nuclear orphan protein 1 isoform X2 [Trachypithecus francoisi]